MNVRDFVDDLGIANGATMRRNCPVCNGQKTFTVSNKDGMLVWNCYKAGCFVHGGTRSHLSADDIRNTLHKEEQEEPAWEKPDYIVPIRPHADIQKFLSRWSLQDMKPHALYDAKEHRVVFPIFKGRTLVDGTGRSLAGRPPKWKRYGGSGLPYVYGAGSTAVIVEDAISATVIGSRDKYTGVALLGTSLQDTHKKILLEYKKLIVALDPDAMKKTLNIARELRAIHTQVSVLRLSDDLKYQNHEDIRALKWL